MYLEDEALYDKYPEFKNEIETMEFGDSGSAMRMQSLQSIKTWRMGMPPRMKRCSLVDYSLRFSETKDAPRSRSAKRSSVNYRPSLKTVSISAKTALLLEPLLSLRVEFRAALQGMTTPEPDNVYGLTFPRFPVPNIPVFTS